MPPTPPTVALNTRSQAQKPSTAEIMKAIESLATSQSSPFSELKSSIFGLTSQVVDLVTENMLLFGQKFQFSFQELIFLNHDRSSLVIRLL